MGVPQCTTCLDKTRLMLVLCMHSGCVREERFPVPDELTNAEIQN